MLLEQGADATVPVGQVRNLSTSLSLTDDCIPNLLLYVVWCYCCGRRQDQQDKKYDQGMSSNNFSVPVLHAKRRSPFMLLLRRTSQEMTWAQ
jgi:hypothetical protein